jgi:hypothetical protein
MIAREDPRVLGVSERITIQQGPGEVVVALKIHFELTLSAEDLCKAINDYESRLRATCAEARWIFVEPDVRGAVPSVPIAAT